MGERNTGKKDNSRKSGVGARRREIRRERALVRQEEYAALTTEEKLARIESRPGGSKKEKARLQDDS